MGFQYNGKLRSAELLLRENGEVVQIGGRRPRTTTSRRSTWRPGTLQVGEPCRERHLERSGRPETGATWMRAFGQQGRRDEAC